MSERFCSQLPNNGGFAVCGRIAKGWIKGLDGGRIYLCGVHIAQARRQGRVVHELPREEA